ncbi:hypothetical protein DW322_02335 [Rhodococcus rhodnii]|uniref:LLM class flavin-dependent oxidoreductase n=1 Tax=Rhodococcus rhodnii TaxID=38312 RepID=A0A6P2CC78_9NOCA|nr:hypothetical protein DW322_02335 [Rhodococcus rhodnii]
MRGDGHHPGAPASARAGALDTWVDLTSPADDPLDPTAQPPHLVRVRATDLRDAREQYVRLRSDGSAAALLDVEVLLADDARSARARLAELEGIVATRPTTVRYVGTPLGLAGLISDIGSAGVADGVTLQPLAAEGSLTRIARGTVPWLAAHGLVADHGAVARAAALAGIDPAVAAV